MFVPQFYKEMTVAFEAGKTYADVFLLFIDTAGHSTIVRENPRDRAKRAFDLVQTRIADRLNQTASRNRCGDAELWNWQGDGGLFVIHDVNESVSAQTALETALAVLRVDLPHLQDEFVEQDLAGELHLRLSLHKGVLVYPGADAQGSIHSADLNFAAHLEQAVPADHLGISAEVFTVASKYKGAFVDVGTFEGRQIYLHSPVYAERATQLSWLTSHGLGSEMTRVTSLHERPSAYDKGRLIRAASTEVFDLGTALNTCSNYLVTTERPAAYRDAVVDLLQRGGYFRCYQLSVDSPAMSEISRKFGEDTVQLTKTSLDRFRLFKERHPDICERFEVYAMAEYPGFAALGMDMSDAPYGCVLLSPYVAACPADAGVQRGDLPHFLISRANKKLFEQVSSAINSFRSEGNTTRIL
jgi:hypothetical protein